MLTLKEVEGRGCVQAMWVALETGKDKETQGLRKGTQSADTLILPQDTHVGLLTYRMIR